MGLKFYDVIEAYDLKQEAHGSLSSIDINDDVHN